MEGRVRRFRGFPYAEVAETHTTHSHPSVGTPIDVPLPRNVSVATIDTYRTIFGPGIPPGVGGEPGACPRLAAERAKA